MPTILVYVGLAVVALWVLGRIPLIGDLLVPLAQGVGRLIEGLFRVLGGWMLWMVRGVLYAHYDLARHLRYSREELDPSESVDYE